MLRHRFRVQDGLGPICKPQIKDRGKTRQTIRHPEPLPTWISFCLLRPLSLPSSVARGPPSEHTHSLTHTHIITVQFQTDTHQRIPLSIATYAMVLHWLLLPSCLPRCGTPWPAHLIRKPVKIRHIFRLENRPPRFYSWAPHPLLLLRIRISTKKKDHNGNLRRESRMGECHHTIDPLQRGTVATTRERLQTQGSTSYLGIRIPIHSGS